MNEQEYEYIVELRCLGGWDDAGWTVDDQPMRFSTIEEARAEIEEVIEELREHNAAPSDLTAEDFRVVKVRKEGL